MPAAAKPPDPAATRPADSVPGSSAMGWSRGFKRVGGGSALALAILVCGLAAVLRHQPAFYGQRMAAAHGLGQEVSARRLVSDLSALRSAVERPGDWEAAIDEDDINDWLATDLERNHRGLLPGMVSEPRVRLTPRRIEVGWRLGAGLFSTVAWATAEVRLREPNQLAIVLEDVRLGGLPLPRGPILAEIARRCRPLGVVTVPRPLDGRSGLVCSIPSKHGEGGPSHWLESFSIGEGTIAVSGRTVHGRERPPAR